MTTSEYAPKGSRWALGDKAYTADGAGTFTCVTEDGISKIGEEPGHGLTLISPKPPAVQDTDAAAENMLKEDASPKEKRGSRAKTKTSNEPSQIALLTLSATEMRDAALANQKPNTGDYLAVSDWGIKELGLTPHTVGKAWGLDTISDEDITRGRLVAFAERLQILADNLRTSAEYQDLMDWAAELGMDRSAAVDLFAELNPEKTSTTPFTADMFVRFSSAVAQWRLQATCAHPEIEKTDQPNVWYCHECKQHLTDEEPCPDEDSHEPELPCLSCGKPAEELKPAVFDAGGHYVNELGEVVKVDAVLQVLGLTEYPVLPADPTDEEMGWFIGVMDRVVDIIASCREKAARYKKQGEKRAKAKLTRAEFYERTFAHALTQLGSRIIPKIQTGDNAGKYKRQFVDLESGRVSFSTTGGLDINKELIQAQIDALSDAELKELQAEGFPIRIVRSIDWTKVSSALKKDRSKWNLDGVDYATPNQLGTVKVSATKADDTVAEMPAKEYGDAETDAA